jgi:hypothetical protein
LLLVVAFREMLRPVLARHGRASGVYVVVALSSLGLVPIVLGLADVSDAVALPVVFATTFFAIGNSIVVMYRRAER